MTSIIIVAQQHLEVIQEQTLQGIIHLGRRVQEPVLQGLQPQEAVLQKYLLQEEVRTAVAVQ